LYAEICSDVTQTSREAYNTVDNSRQLAEVSTEDDVDTAKGVVGLLMVDLAKAFIYAAELLEAYYNLLVDDKVLYPLSAVTLSASCATGMSSRAPEIGRCERECKV
jgi:hypothetical protein